MQSASFWKRFIAIVIDTVFLNVMLLLLSSFLGFFIGGMLHEKELIMDSMRYSAPIGVLFFWLYFALQESSQKQATLGKRLMGIYVTTTAGDPLSFAQASVRFFSKYLSSILFIGFIMALFTQKNQALHDIIADTLVIDR